MNPPLGPVVCQQSVDTQCCIHEMDSLSVRMAILVDMGVPNMFINVGLNTIEGPELGQYMSQLPVSPSNASHWFVVKHSCCCSLHYICCLSFMHIHSSIPPVTNPELQIIVIATRVAKGRQLFGKFPEISWKSSMGS